MLPQTSATANGLDHGRTNVGEAERLASNAIGGLLLFAAFRRRGLTGLVLGAIGGGLLHRGVTGHCALYEAIGVDPEDATPYSHPLNRRVRTSASITVNKPAEEVYALWRDFESLARLLPQVRSVRETGENTSRWVCEAPDGQPYEFDAQVTEDLPNRKIAWRSCPASEVEHEGRVTFTPAPLGRGTEVRVETRYIPPGGLTPMVWAALSHKRPFSNVAQALRVFKQFLETGEVTTNARSLGQTDRQTRNWLGIHRNPHEQDTVTEASEESFPASDAPAHTASSGV